MTGLYLVDDSTKLVWNVSVSLEWWKEPWKLVYKNCEK